MTKRKQSAQSAKTTDAIISCKAQLWQIADVLHDMLLPKLIFGEIRIKDAERFLHEQRL